MLSPITPGTIINLERARHPKRTIFLLFIHKTYAQGYAYVSWGWFMNNFHRTSILWITSIEHLSSVLYRFWIFKYFYLPSPLQAQCKVFLPSICVWKRSGGYEGRGSACFEMACSYTYNTKNVYSSSCVTVSTGIFKLFSFGRIGTEGREWARLGHSHHELVPCS